MVRRYCVPLLVLLSTGCSPVYQTDYTFTPPESSEGRACVFQCENTKLQCQQLQQSRYDLCLQRAELAYQNCEARKIYRYDYDKGEAKCVENCFCYRESCSVDTTSCDAQHRACYQTCGGGVSSRTYCVSNCEEVGGVGAAPGGALQ
ncbi:MAG: hypothetical protein KDD69_09680 [Bdellovibrionales bacterium]|nr:hypothetical protein [Bdellovibrionales bacterium]